MEAKQETGIESKVVFREKDLGDVTIIQGTIEYRHAIALKAEDIIDSNFNIVEVTKDRIRKEIADAVRAEIIP